jgi:hypothetical protein
MCVYERFHGSDDEYCSDDDECPVVSDGPVKFYESRLRGCWYFLLGVNKHGRFIVVSFTKYEQGLDILYNHDPSKIVASKGIGMRDACKLVRMVRERLPDWAETRPYCISDELLRETLIIADNWLLDNNVE